MITRERNYRKHPHTASFLQTFHTAQTEAQRRNGEPSMSSQPRQVEEASAVSFVTGRPARNDGSRMVTVMGYPVKVDGGNVTEKQARWMIDIATTRVLPAGATAESVLVRLEQGFAKFAGSQFITTYKDLPRVTAETMEAVASGADTEEFRAAATTRSTEVEEDGIYVDPIKGRIFKVQFNKGQGSGQRLYAKQLWIELPAGYRSEDLLSLDLTGIDRDDISSEWRYAPGLIRSIKPEWKLTLGQAEKFGQLYGRCVRCHRALTKELSIRRSMGDTCASASGF